MEAQPAVGGVVYDSRVDGDWWSDLQRSTEGTEWSNAAGELHGDVQSHGERSDDQYGADSVHGGVRLPTLTAIVLGGFRFARCKPNALTQILRQSIMYG